MTGQSRRGLLAGAAALMAPIGAPAEICPTAGTHPHLHPEAEVLNHCASLSAVRIQCEALDEVMSAEATPRAVAERLYDDARPASGRTETTWSTS